MTEPQRCQYPSCDCDGPEGPACGLPGYAEVMTAPIMVPCDNCQGPRQYGERCGYCGGTVTDTCKHCGLSIQGDTGNWLHAEGAQLGLHRCALEPYGFDAAPAHEPCSFACLGGGTQVSAR